MKRLEDMLRRHIVRWYLLSPMEWFAQPIEDREDIIEETMEALVSGLVDAHFAVKP